MSPYLPELISLSIHPPPLSPHNTWISPSYTAEQIEYIHPQLHTAQEPPEVAALWADPAYTVAQMKMLRIGLMQGLDQDQMEILRDPDLSPDQMRTLMTSLISGLNVDQVRMYSSPEFSVREMNLLTRSLIKHQLDPKDLPVVSDPQLQFHSMQSLILDLSRGVDMKTALKAATRKLNTTETLRCEEDATAYYSLQSAYREEKAKLLTPSRAQSPSYEMEM